MPSPFVTRVEGDTRKPDLVMVRKALEVLIAPETHFQVFSLPSARGIWCCSCNLDGAIVAVEAMSDQDGIYYTLHPMNPGSKIAKSSDAISRYWLLIDIDVIRQNHDVSATDAEKAAAYILAVAIVEWLMERGWPAPIIIDSGNGWHLLFRIDLPNDKLSQQLVKQVLEVLGSRFDSPAAKIDRAVHDARRVAKLPGTWVRKGPDTPDRPHRMSRIVFEPDRIDVVSIDQLRELIDTPREPTTGNPWVTPVGQHDLSAYVRSAIDRESVAMRICPEGERNVKLNRAAFCLGTMASWPEMNGRDAKATLAAAAIRSGLGEEEVVRTIDSGWTAGTSEPRPRPLSNFNPSQNGKATDALVKLTVKGHQIKPEKVVWLWKDRIAIDFLTIFAGRTGIGKSFVAMDIAARLTRGSVLPDKSSPGVSNAY